ncbi:MAG TPA: hypothetical protein VK658_24600 [Chryseolinea sp.]|nr:hypothetical protein [Chryseolinea sp.]
MSFTDSKEIYSPIIKHLDQYQKEFDRIPEDRRKALKRLALFIEEKRNSGGKAELIFICTHNSRRSHIAQIWAQTAAAYYSISGVVTYSGGTEATAFNPRAVKAMSDIGFKIIDTTGGENPLYEIRFADDTPAIKAFSKKYDSDKNPKQGFGAIMTCSQADQNCPVVLGAALRIATPYDDPKDFDGTPQESEKYTERTHEIGRDILYAFSLVKL